jgi:hypothetical protein
MRAPPYECPTGIISTTLINDPQTNPDVSGPSTAQCISHGSLNIASKALTEPLSSFIPITGPGASGCSSLALLLASLSSSRVVACPLAVFAFWSWPSRNFFMPSCDASPCVSRRSRCVAWSSAGRPLHPGREFCVPFSFAFVEAKCAVKDGRSCSWVLR